MTADGVSNKPDGRNVWGKRWKIVVNGTHWHIRLPETAEGVGECRFCSGAKCTPNVAPRPSSRTTCDGDNSGTFSSTVPHSFWLLFQKATGQIPVNGKP